MRIILFTMIRCGGRIHNAPTSDLPKFPYLLPSRHPLATLIIMDTYQKLHHAGASNTLCQVYWIPAIRQKVRYYISVLFATNYQGNLTGLQTLPHYPKHMLMKVHHSHFTGALYIKDRGEEKKAYICLFTCAATRAVHLEIVQDLSVESFLLAFRRFACRKSFPRKILSDNASTYLVVMEDLQKLFKSDTLKETLGYQNITWNFILKRAPWYGGL